MAGFGKDKRGNELRWFGHGHYIWVDGVTRYTVGRTSWKGVYKGFKGFIGHGNRGFRDLMVS